MMGHASGDYTSGSYVFATQSLFLLLCFGRLFGDMEFSSMDGAWRMKQVLWAQFGWDLGNLYMDFETDLHAMDCIKSLGKGLQDGIAELGPCSY